MKKLISIDFRSMAGLGPKAWDRDDSRLSMHTSHPHHEKHPHLAQEKSTRQEGKGTDKHSD